MIGFPYHAAESYFAKIVKKHDLYIIENDADKQFIPSVANAEKQLIDEETGKLFDLTESEMREFDGDIEEPHEIINTDKSEFIETDSLAREKEFAEAFDNDAVCRLSDIIGDCFILV